MEAQVDALQNRMKMYTRANNFTLIQNNKPIQNTYNKRKILKGIKKKITP